MKQKISVKMEKDKFTRKWITEHSIDIVNSYEKGILTIRGLHYQLVSIGMTNDMRHYKRVVSAMIEARWNGLIDFDSFSDNDREMIGNTQYEEVRLESEIENGKKQVKRGWKPITRTGGKTNSIIRKY
jgi:hypothetical protein